VHPPTPAILLTLSIRAPFMLTIPGGELDSRAPVTLWTIYSEFYLYNCQEGGKSDG